MEKKVKAYNNNVHFKQFQDHLNFYREIHQNIKAERDNIKHYFDIERREMIRISKLEKMAGIGHSTLQKFIKGKRGLSPISVILLANKLCQLRLGYQTSSDFNERREWMSALEKMEAYNEGWEDEFNKKSV